MSRLYLPEELLQLILLNLKLPLGFSNDQQRENDLLTKTLVSCMLASRTLHRLAEPILYHTIVSERLMPALEYNPRRSRLAQQVRRLTATRKTCRIIMARDVMGELFQRSSIRDDMEWDDYLRSWLSEFPHNSFHQCPIHVGYILPVASLEVMTCTGLHDLVLSDGYNAEDILPANFLKLCAAQARHAPEGVGVALAELRTFKIETSVPDHEPDDLLDLDANNWFGCLASLPRIESICVPKAMVWPPYNEVPQNQTSNPKSLTLTCMALDPSRLEAILRMFPVLQNLDVTWPTQDTGWAPSKNIWADLGKALCRYGTSLRRIRFDTSHVDVLETPRGALVNLTSLHNLRSLALPIEAVLSEPAGEYWVPTGEDEDESPTPHQAGQGLKTPTVPLRYILPPQLKHLNIMDEWNLWVDTFRLDMQLHDLIVLPEFSSLRSVRVRRRTSFTKHVHKLGWNDQKSGQFWQIMERS